MTTIVVQTVSPVRVFLAFLMRDIFVVFRKQFVSLLGRVLVQPLLTVFVFSYVLPSIAGVSRSFGRVLAPGILANSMLFAGLLGVTVPLITELSYPKTIQDRLLTPVPVWTVAVERIVSGGLQSLFAAVLVFPIVTFLHAPGQAPALSFSHWPLLVLMLVLGSAFSGALGLLLGAIVEPAKVNVLFSIIMIPLMMLGCVYYPWAALSAVPWLQILVLANPVVYLSEALRAALTPDMPHLSTWVVLAVLCVGTVIVTILGLRAFRNSVLG